jgi:hypothetical protein
MTEARRIALEPVVRRVGGLDLVVVSPNDPSGPDRGALAGSGQSGGRIVPAAPRAEGGLAVGGNADLVFTAFLWQVTLSHGAAGC